MKTVKRRTFLSQFSCLVGAAFVPLSIEGQTYAESTSERRKNEKVCWLDVTAPFVIENSQIGLHSEIVLTSDTFNGIKGHEDGTQLTDYEVYLYDSSGKAVAREGVAKRLTVPAMHTTVFSVREILGAGKDFFGGMKIRLRPRNDASMHASDLFSSAFLRLTSDSSFDMVHANPDPLQWQRPDSFYYSMPFPSLRQYACFFSLFNPNREHSEGSITVHDQDGRVLRETRYALKPHSSLVFDLRQGSFVKDFGLTFSDTARAETSDPKKYLSAGGTIAVINTEGSAKSFGYLLIKNPDLPRFSIDHPIHQSPFNLVKAKAPFDDEGRFKVKNILYTPMVFRSKKIGGVTLDSRFYFSSGSPIEEHLWLNPFVTDANGEVAWQQTNETKLPATISPKQIERGVIKLGRNQSCTFDCAETTLPKNFSGGLSLAIAPLSNHTLMKVEVRVPEWGAHAFTHFRPGLYNARAYQKAKQRGGIATDYVTTGARLESNAEKVLRDTIIGVMNIDDKNSTGLPTLEVFSTNGLVVRVKLGEVPGFSCRHYLLSELLPGKSIPSDLTLRLVDDNSTLLMSILHLDYSRRDIALDHGSDRFSTFQDFNCDPAIR